MNDDIPDHDDDAPVQEPRLWQGNGWTARVIKNEDDDGWAVAMIFVFEPSSNTHILRKSNLHTSRQNVPVEIHTR